MFEREFTVGWADLDANAHMRNTAYLDRCVDLRMIYFAAHGFPVETFARLRIGPVLKREEIEYYRELHLLDRFIVSLALAGLSADASRFRLRSELLRTDRSRVASVVSTGGWLDLDKRRLIAPPEPLDVAMRGMPKTQDFAELPSSLRTTPPRGSSP
jgi:acyl-CoA thioester hydrolase